MKIISSPQEMRDFSKSAHAEGKSIVLVPTMGALHEGHLSLIKIAKQNGDICVVSIFVNPTQFGANEDFSKYPRTLEKDLEACRTTGADVVFTPNNEDIYLSDASTHIHEDQISKHLCGVSRPKLFQGVATVVAILFNITAADKAVFGIKDAQQVAIIRRMVRDLFMGVEIIEAPIIREDSGLAMSSRNNYLDPLERNAAKRIYEALLAGKKLVDENCTNVDRVKTTVINAVSNPKTRVIYTEVVDRLTSLPVNTITPGKCRISVAVWYGQTRLIDNLEI